MAHAFELLASTGLRISEAIGLRVIDAGLDTSAPCVHVRRAIVNGQLTAPKSRHGRRTIPISLELVTRLRTLTTGRAETTLLFRGAQGAALRPGNLRYRVLIPAAHRAGVPWARFHTLRHTCGGDAHRRRCQPASPAALDGPSLRRVHPRYLRPPAPRRSRSASRLGPGDRMTDRRARHSAIYVTEQGRAGTQQTRALDPPDRSRWVQPERGGVGPRRECGGRLHSSRHEPDPEQRAPSSALIDRTRGGAMAGKREQPRGPVARLTPGSPGEAIAEHRAHWASGRRPERAPGQKRYGRPHPWESGRGVP